MTIWSNEQGVISEGNRAEKAPGKSYRLDARTNKGPLIVESLPRSTSSRSTASSTGSSGAISFVRTSLTSEVHIVNFVFIFPSFLLGASEETRRGALISFPLIHFGTSLLCCQSIRAAASVCADLTVIERRDLYRCTQSPPKYIFLLPLSKKHNSADLQLLAVQPPHRKKMIALVTQIRTCDFSNHHQCFRSPLF